MKILSVGVEFSMRPDRMTDGQTDVTKLIVGRRNFANAPKNHISVRNISRAFHSLGSH